jgi:hypothetical protein
MLNMLLVKITLRIRFLYKLMLFTLTIILVTNNELAINESKASKKEGKHAIRFFSWFWVISITSYSMLEHQSD